MRDFGAKRERELLDLEVKGNHQLLLQFQREIMNSLHRDLLTL